VPLRQPQYPEHPSIVQVMEFTREELPAVVTVGGYELQHGLGRLWAELVSGAVIHIVAKNSGLHRAWLVPELPDGFETRRITCNELTRRVGWALNQVRDGMCFEVYDGSRRMVRGYLMLTPPDCLARLDIALQYTRRARTGRVVYREFRPTGIEAVSA
jgi:hypothetical protein